MAADHPRPLVTEAMKGAGAQVLHDWFYGDEGINALTRIQLAEKIYLAMRKCAPFDGHPTTETGYEFAEIERALADRQALGTNLIVDACKEAGIID